MFRQLEQRDWQLWTLTLVVLLILGAFVSVVSLWKWKGMADAGWSEWVRNVMFLGFVGLTLLFCAHVVFQQRVVKRLRRRLLAEETCHRALHLEISDLESVVANMVSDREREKVKSEFIAAASHRLRTPLTNIRNSMDAVVQEKAGPLNSEQGRFLKVAVRDAEHLARLIDHLLDLSKIESGRAPFTFESVDIEDLVGDAVRGFLPAAERKRIDIVVDVSGEGLKVRADRERIRQVLDNVLANAVQFTPEDGRIRVQVRRMAAGDWDRVAEKTQFHPHPFDHEDYVEVAVEDAGVGLSKDDLQAVFEEFTRIDDGSGARACGEDLGLAVARDLVRAHEGAIWAEKRESGGTVFRFVLPIRGASVERLESVRHIGEAIANARRQDESLSLVMIRVLSAERGIPEEGAGDIHKVLEDLAGFAQRAIRGSDTLVMHSALREIHLFLARTGEEGGRMVSERVRSMIEQFRRDRPGVFADYRIQIGFASFPDDAMTAVDIEEMARRGDEVPCAIS